MGIWDKPFEENLNCDICGDKRTYTWNVGSFIDTYVDEQNVTDDPLGDFVFWLLHHFNEKPSQRAYQNIALSHFGGKYDMVLCFGEIFRQGGLRPTIINRGNKLIEMRVAKSGVITKTTFRDT